MSTVNLEEYLLKYDERKIAHIEDGSNYETPENKIIKNNLGGNRYRVLLCTFNVVSFQKVYNFQIDKETLTEIMDKFVGKQIGELDQQVVKERMSSVIDVLTVNPDSQCGILNSYEIVVSDDGMIELYGDITLTDLAASLCQEFPHYFSIRSIGLGKCPKDGITNFKISAIGGFDLEPALFH